MAFFKNYRDQLKANALVSHLEFARDRFPHNHALGLDHLASAVKAVVNIKNSAAQGALTFAGWKYVVQVTCELSAVLSGYGCDESFKDCDYIVEHAKRWRDEAAE